MTLPREYGLPSNNIKVSDKKSDAVAYVYFDQRGRPCAKIFFGKQSKPYSHSIYLSAQAREKDITRCFEARQASLAYVDRRRAERKNFDNTYKVGDIFVYSGGYEQTNVKYYEVTEVKGSMLLLREIAQERKYNQAMAGQTYPLVGQYVGSKVIRCRAQSRIKIDDHRYASLVRPTMKAGVGVFEGQYFSEYA